MKTIIIGCLILGTWIGAGTAYYTCKTHCRCGMSSTEMGADNALTQSEEEGKSNPSTSTQNGSESDLEEGIEGGGEGVTSEEVAGDTENPEGSEESPVTEPAEEIRLEGADITQKTLYCPYNSPHFEQNAALTAYATDIKSYLQSHPTANVEIEGHTDNVGSIWYNRRLGKQRAENFHNFLKGQGVATDRMKVVTKGEAVPIADNATEVGREKNRRIEISIQ